MTTYMGGMGWEMGGEFSREGTYVYLWLIHVDIRQGSTQYCNAIIFQLKKEKKSQHICIIANEKLLYNTESSNLVLCDNLEV